MNANLILHQYHQIIIFLLYFLHLTTYSSILIPIHIYIINFISSIYLFIMLLSAHCFSVRNTTYCTCLLSWIDIKFIVHIYYLLSIKPIWAYLKIIYISHRKSWNSIYPCSVNTSERSILVFDHSFIIL